MGINLLAVGLAALAAFFLGFIWYTVAFAKPWQALIGMGEKGTGASSTAETPNLGRLLIGSLLLEIVMAFALAYVIGDGNALDGLVTGIVVGLGLVGLAFGVNYLFEGHPIRLWLINAGYNTVVFAAMGAIIGAF